MYIWLVSYRYLLSRPISWVSVLGVMLGVGSLFVVDSVMNGFITESRRVIRGRTSDIIVMPREESDAFCTAISKAIEDVDGVAATSPRLNRPVLFRAERIDVVMQTPKFANRCFLEVSGIDFTKEDVVSDIRRFLSSSGTNGMRVADPADPFRVDRAKLPREYRNADPTPLLLGERTFEEFGLRPYEVVKLVSYPDNASFDSLTPISVQCVIVGTFKTDDYKFDSSNALMPIERMRDFINAKTGAHEIAVAVKPGHDFHQVKDELQHTLGRRAEVETWEDRHANYLSAVDNERGILNVVLFFIVLVALFLVFATLSMMVTDKIKDIGILSSMGATPLGIAGIFVACGNIVVIAGVSLGLALGYLVTSNINSIRIFLEQRFGLYIFKPNVYVFTEIPAQIDPGRLSVFVTVVFVFGILASVIPAVRAAYLHPVRALRYE
jgi:lipoprotein-releasing system permease protein